MGVGPARLAGTFQASLTRARPVAGRLSLGALGLALALLVSAACGTGIWYLMARLGYGSPVRLAAMDGVHVYVGLVGGVFVVAKVARVGLRYRVRGVPGVVPWQRWLSWSLLTLYSAVFLTGVLLLLPIRGRPYSDLVELHLLTSIWALLPTTWHVWHYRARALPYLGGRRIGAAALRFWAAGCLVVLPGLGLIANPFAVSQLPGVMGGSAWSPAGLGDSYLDAIAVTPDGRRLLAAGDALYVSHDGVVWVRIDLPAGGAAPAAQPAATDAHAGHEHGGQPAPANPITALAVGPDAIFVGTAQGLYRSAGLDGPLAPVGPPGVDVRSLSQDPSDPRSVWAASAAGPLFSADAGGTWTSFASGLERLNDAAAIAYLGPDVFVSDTTGVFRWAPDLGSWVRTSRQASVIDLSADETGHRIYASSPSGDIQAYDGAGWKPLAAPAPVHHHHGHVHGQPAGVIGAAGRLYAAGTSDGVSASDDGGQTWTQLGGGLASTTTAQVVDYRGSLWAATSSGLYRYPLIASPAASWRWWLVVLGLAAVIGLVTAAISALPRPPLRQGPPPPAGGGGRVSGRRGPPS